MHKSKKSRWILISVAAVLVVAAALGGWYFLGHRNSEPVNAFPFLQLGMTEYWGDSQESYGPVTTDKIQTIYVSNTQTVTEILVAEGDTVKKGDLLMTFDTTLSDLSLERERLKVEKLKLQMQDAKNQLAQINAMKPMVIPVETEPEEGEEENLGAHIGELYQISNQSAYDGNSMETSLICWIASTTAIDDNLLETIRLRAEEYQQSNALAEAEKEAAEETQGTQENQEIQETQETQETVPVEPVSVNSFYVIFKVTQSDRALGGKLVWQGVRVTKVENEFAMRLFDASGIADHMSIQADNAVQTPEIDYGSGYTAAQIAQMRSEQEKTIKDLNFQIRMAEAEYKIKLTEASDGKVYAKIDGVVMSLLTEEEAREQGQPLMKVSGGGGFYVEGAVSELEKDNLKVGQEVTINDWNTGMVYTGTIRSVGDFPATNGSWNGMGNPNVSYYPFTVYVDESADLQEGRYVSVMYSSAEAQNGLYLENFMIRTEQGQSYLYVLGADGTLEKRFVTTGKSLWGSYTEILDGLTAEDYLAFPYGKNVRDGAKAVACEDLSKLYG